MINETSLEIELCVAYARVSTEHESQAESCSNQMKLCDEYVMHHPELSVVHKYVDDGITGATNERPEFNAMINRIQKGDIRYIIAKNEDRLCRSTEVDGYVQKICREYDVRIIFIESNSIFNPYDGDHVTIHGFKAVMSQQYVFHQSKVGTIAHQQKCKAKRLNATDIRYGYYWDYKNKCMAINEEEAKMVRRMFEWYVYGGLGVTEIAKKLAELDVYGSRSGKILTANTVSSRLADESYKGTFYLNKKGSVLNVGMNAKKKRFNRPKEEWIPVPGPAIVSAELFDLAQRLREERRRIYDTPSTGTPQARFRGTHLFAGKVFCGDCGTQFHFRFADRAQTIGEYKDYFSKSKKTLDAVCNNTHYNRIREDTLINLCKYSINVFLKSHEECIDNLVQVIHEANQIAINDNEPMKILQKKLTKIEKELNSNLVAWRDAPEHSMKAAYFEMYQKNKAEKDELEQHLQKLSDRQKDTDSLERGILDIKKRVEKMKQINMIERSIVEKFIDRIVVNRNGKINIILKFNSIYEALLEQKELIYFDESKQKINTWSITNLKYIKEYTEFQMNMSDTPSARCSDGA